MRRTTTARMAVLCAAMLSASAASAQTATDKRTQAQALFDQAMTAMDHKAYDEACPKLEGVVELQPGKLGAIFWLAQCYEAQGKIASAWTQYRAVGDTAPPSDSLKKKAQDKAAELEPRLPRLTISVSAPVRAIAGLEIARDGIQLAPALWGAKLPVDPGHHTVTATATGKKPWTGDVEAAVSGVPITLEVAPLEDATVAQAPPVVPIATPAASNADTAAHPTQPASAPSNRRVIGAVVGGVGVVGVIVGAVFGARAFSKLSDSNADNHCHDGNQCDATGRDLRADSLKAGNVSTAAFVAGGVLLGAGVVIFATAPKASSTQTKVGLGPRGIEVLGTW
jgi:hypothetical protein